MFLNDKYNSPISRATFRGWQAWSQNRQRIRELLVRSPGFSRCDVENALAYGWIESLAG